MLAADKAPDSSTFVSFGATRHVGMPKRFVKKQQDFWGEMTVLFNHPIRGQSIILPWGEPIWSSIWGEYMLKCTFFFPPRSLYVPSRFLFRANMITEKHASGRISGRVCPSFKFFLFHFPQLGPLHFSCSLLRILYVGLPRSIWWTTLGWSTALNPTTAIQEMCLRLCLRVRDTLTNLGLTCLILSPSWLTFSQFFNLVCSPGGSTLVMLFRQVGITRDPEGEWASQRCAPTLNILLRCIDCVQGTWHFAQFQPLITCLRTCLEPLFRMYIYFQVLHVSWPDWSGLTGDWNSERHVLIVYYLLSLEWGWYVYDHHRQQVCNI